MLPPDYSHFPCRLTPPAVNYPGIPGLPAAEGRTPYYADTGGSLSSSYLSCALPKCVLDMTASEVAQIRRALSRCNHPPTETSAEILNDARQPTKREVLELRHRSLGLNAAAPCQKLLDRGRRHVGCLGRRRRPTGPPPPARLLGGPAPQAGGRGTGGTVPVQAHNIPCFGAAGNVPQI